MVYREIPKDFEPKFSAAGCIIQVSGEILLLLRQEGKPQANTWGLPSGKLNPGETPLSAIIREILEETGYFATPSEPKLATTVYVKYPEIDFIYHLFHLSLQKKFPVTIDTDEHTEFAWVTPERAFTMPGIAGLNECLAMFFR